MPEKSKRPNRVVVADDFVVNVDGELIYPHAGESVTFVGRLTTNDLMHAMKLQRIDLDADDADQQLDQVRQFLAGRIAAWEWTDDEGEPYPNPPSPADIGRLDMDELGWLLANGIRPKNRETAVGEASTPST
ncbi:MAG: hypothetical protein AB7P33_09875 [Dehalococcoidia bacterium]